MKLNLSKHYQYIPEWNDNRDEESPITFHCKYLSPAESDRCVKIGSLVEINRGKLFELSVLRIDNLQVDDKFVCTPKELLVIPQLMALYSEVVTYIMSANNEAPSKNLGSPST